MILKRFLQFITEEVFYRDSKDDGVNAEEHKDRAKFKYWTTTKSSKTVYMCKSRSKDEPNEISQEEYELARDGKDKELLKVRNRLIKKYNRLKYICEYILENDIQEKTYSLLKNSLTHDNIKLLLDFEQKELEDNCNYIFNVYNFCKNLHNNIEAISSNNELKNIENLEKEIDKLATIDSSYINTILDDIEEYCEKVKLRDITPEESQKRKKQVETILKQKLGDGIDIRLDDFPIEVQENIVIGVKLFTNKFPLIKNKLNVFVTNNEELKINHNVIEEARKNKASRDFHKKQIKKVIENIKQYLKSIGFKDNIFSKLTVKCFLDTYRLISTAKMSNRLFYGLLKLKLDDDILSKPLSEMEDIVADLSYDAFLNAISEKIKSIAEKSSEANLNYKSLASAWCSHIMKATDEKIIHGVIINSELIENYKLRTNYLEKVRVDEEYDTFHVNIVSEKYPLIVITIAHELSHLLSDLLELNQKQISNENIIVYKSNYPKIEKLFEEYIKNFPKQSKDAFLNSEDIISTYAMLNIEEFIAECLADVLTNEEEATETSKKVFDIVEKIYKDKVSSGEITESKIIKEIMIND